MKQFSGELNFLSNFYPSPISIELDDGSVETAKTVEHAFQASKTESAVVALRILDTETPGVAKRFGGLVVLRKDWDEIREQIMYDLLKAKFTHYPPLRERLLKVPDDQLTELNDWHDNYWGICTCKRCQDSVEGLDRLGYLLKKLKKELSG